MNLPNEIFCVDDRLNTQIKEGNDEINEVSNNIVGKVSKEHNTDVSDVDTSESDDVASEEEYLPSDESAEDEFFIPSVCTKNPNKSSKVRKYLDDGDVNNFNSRIKEWKVKRKKSFKNDASPSTNKEEKDTVTRESKSFDGGCHEISNGLKIPNDIWKQLYRYQKTGIKWLWELHQIGSGGLLGDEMGLGKTVQVISFFAALSVSKLGSWAGLGPSVVVAPATVLHQWVAHFHHWWPPLRVAVLHNSGSFRGAPDKLIRDIHNNHGVLITTYTGIVQHKSAIEGLKWHYVVLDEGHKIRNSETQVSKAVRKFRTPHRLVVTGSPMQNNLQELWSLFDFMSPGLLGTLPAFVEHFANPITQGGYTNASKWQETAALSLATTLKEVITPYMLRRTKVEVKDHIKLPEKKEQVLFCSLSAEQKDIYKSFLLSNTVRSILDKESRFGDPFRARILIALSTLRKICNHPDLFIYEIDEDAQDDAELSKKSLGYWRRSGKMVVINSLLKIWKKQGHRVLIFTQSRAMLCILELFLQQNDYKYLKMDGTTSIGTRQPLVTLFNSDESHLVFLATTRVGGLGVNLTGADRVIIYDPDWNPATDSQAKERAWRIGQNRDVTIYRLLSAGTIEEKIYQRQVFKQLLSNKVLLDPNQKNYLRTSTLQGLFSFEEPGKGESTETATIFKHTQVMPNVHPKKLNDDVNILNGGVSFSKTKLDAMRRLAKKINQQFITTDTNTNATEEVENPRERYKKSLLPAPEPSPPQVPPVNMLNDQETNADFSTIISELDIINMYSKTQPLHFLNTEDKNSDIEDGEIVNTDSKDISLESDASYMKKNENLTCIQNTDDGNKNISCTIKNKNVEVYSSKEASCSYEKKSRKRQKQLEKLIEEEGLNQDEDFLQNIQKIKRKKRKSEPKSPEDPDQYVLEKLFAKSGVQNALQHDKVVGLGLAERQERYRLRTEAQQKAVIALKALRKSRLKNWRW